MLKKISVLKLVSFNQLMLCLFHFRVGAMLSLLKQCSSLGQVLTRDPVITAP